MKMIFPTRVFIIVAAVSSVGFGAEFRAFGLRPVEARIFSRESLPTRLTTVLPAPSEIKWTATLGGAYTDGDDGTNTWSTPFQFQAGIGPMTYTLQGDGYVHPSGSATGLADPTFIVRRSWQSDDQKTTSFVGGGVTFPVGGPVGGNKFGERVLAGLVRALPDNWAVVVVGSLLRAEGAQPNGHAAYLQVGVAQLQYAIDASTTGSLQFVTVHRNGGGTKNQLTAELDFPISGKFTGAFLVTRGLTRGARDTTVELDFTMPFKTRLGP